MTYNEERSKRIYETAEKMAVQLLTGSVGLEYEIGDETKELVKTSYRNIFVIAELFHEVAGEKKVF